MWVGSGASDLQMETQLILLQLPELNSFAVLIPLIEGKVNANPMTLWYKVVEK